MINIPDFMPNLRHGSGETPKDGGCLIQIAGWLNDGVSWTDKTPCVHPVFRRLGINFNDWFDDTDRQKLLAFLPRIIGTGLTGDEAEDKRVAVGLAEYAASQAQKFDAAVAVAAANAAAHAAVAAAAAAAVDAAAAADAAANAAANAAYAAYAAGVEAQLGLFSRLLDEYDRLTGREVSGRTVPDEQWQALKHEMQAH